MDDEADRPIVAQHKRWADAPSLISIVIVMGAYLGAYFLMEMAAANPVERLQAHMLLSTIILVVVIWQAVALAVARLQIALERR